LQEIILSEKFYTRQTEFMEKNSQIFEDEEENKLEYMDIFKQYKKTLEKYIMTVFHLYILRVMISL